MDVYVSCPLDPSHRILRTRIQWHLHKCVKNHLSLKKVRCPFNTTHILDAVELDHHMSVCPSSGNVMCYKYCLEPPTQLGTISIEEACAKEPKLCDEDWSGNHPTYDPYTACDKKAFARPLITGSKAKKKEFKKAERQRLAALCGTGDEKVDIEKEAEFDKPLRKPKNAAKALSVNDTCVKAAETNINALISQFEDISTNEDNFKGNSALSIPFSSKKTYQKEVYEKHDKKEGNNNSDRKDISREKIETLYSNPRCAAKFSKSIMARKHSAGRGFTIKSE